MISGKRIKDLVEETRKIKKLKVDPLEILDSYYGEIENELVKTLNSKMRNMKAVRKFVLTYRRRIRNG
ncbi:MAG: hypothetical protein ACP5PQ_00450 [Thermoproteota archaeon]